MIILFWQFFVLNNRSLLSLVELPSLDVPGGGVTAGLCTAHSQVSNGGRDGAAAGGPFTQAYSLHKL